MIIVVGGPCSFLCRDVTVFVCVFQLVFQSEMLDKLIAVGGAMLFSLFIIIDTQLIMHKVSGGRVVLWVGYGEGCCIACVCEKQSL